MKSILLIGAASAVTRLIEGQQISESIPNFYEETSGHSSHNKNMLPDRYTSRTDDRTMNHLIRYYGVQELGKCNDSKPKEGESSVEWNKPVNFVGEFPDCGKPIPGGKVWLNEVNAKKAATEAVRTYFGFTGDKLNNYVKENVEPAWKHFDVLNAGQIDIEQGPQFLRYVINSPEFTFGVQ